jgi:hypothetical protein
MDVVKTKINKPKGSKYFKLFVKIDGKYKLRFKSTNKREVLKQREALRHGLIEAKNYTDVRMDELSYYKLMVINKTLKHKTYNKTIDYLIDKAHADCISSPHDH